MVVDTNRTLTINKGCKVYVNANAPFIVDGTLLINGLKDTVDRVYFQGDRLDEPYKDYPGGWPGIFLRGSSKDNVFNYAVLKNAYQAVVVVNPATSGTKLNLNETIIDNAYDAGLLGINTSIAAKNLLISNCGKNLFLVGGGIYDFKHTTVATFSNSYIQHKDPVFVLTNYLNQTAANLTANFTNCIFWGEQNGFVTNEVFVDAKTITPSIHFNNVVWRMQTIPSFSGLTITGAINQNPLFDSINTAEHFYNFRLKAASPAVNVGVNAGVGIDLDGATRPRPVATLPDLGAYERD